MKDLKNLINSAAQHLAELYKNADIPAGNESRKILEELNREINTIEIQAGELLQENENQKKEILSLRAQLRGDNGLNLKDNVYYTPDGDGPFCPNCYNQRKKLIRIRRVDTGSAPEHACRLCGSKFTG